MSQIAAAKQGSLLDDGNVRLANGAWSRAPMVLMAIGAIGLVIALVGYFSLPKNALAGFHIGAVIATGLGLGAMFYTMVFHLVGAGWSTTIRRQFENIMWCLPVAMVLVIISVAANLFSGADLASWKNPDVILEGHFIEKKAMWLSNGFVLARLVIYFVVWIWLRHILWKTSTGQDATPNDNLSLKARFHSSYGMLLFAFTSTFFAFDWLMALADYRFFSTMWGVYYFAGNIFASLQVCILILAALLRAGKLKGVVTDEHLHDLAKFAFGFTVFWAYIGFGQYFLIWYANLPEETAFFLYRKEHWPILTTALVVGHFIIPFYILLWRPVRRSWNAMAVVAVFLLVTHVVDIYWIVGPTSSIGVNAAEPVTNAKTVLFEVAGIVGVLSVFAAFLVNRVSRGPLVPINDPRLPEGLHHKNYV
jgi:hypothetical protein